ncbi:hypothetical protein BV22DRAFT_936495 [Leucogyrophana mollusca]|uniref:Uncharacterized protein n=1 Tax=Leucogyrophana mollusca TaxID=85980 RepID=A0ACB8AV90_9AGAM|nr:hypothetical protein BV22DRAFT_936495 [Leucogyrophana mollusca]
MTRFPGVVDLRVSIFIAFLSRVRVRSQLRPNCRYCSLADHHNFQRVSERCSDPDFFQPILFFDSVVRHLSAQQPSVRCPIYCQKWRRYNVPKRTVLIGIPFLRSLYSCRRSQSPVSFSFPLLSTSSIT